MYNQFVMMVADARVWLDEANGELSDARLLYDKYLETIDKRTAKNLIEMCQQALEKILKAIFLSQNVASPHPNHVHDLTRLLSKCAFTEPMPENMVRHLQHITRIYVAARYPDSTTIDFLGNKDKMKELFLLTEETFGWISKQI